MKLLLGLFFIAVSDFTQECTNCSKDNERIENCQILEPNTYRSNDRFCLGTSFGVTYKGTLADSKCYATIDEAFAPEKFALVPYLGEVAPATRILSSNQIINSPLLDEISISRYLNEL